jgi:hypothetical protein
MRRHILLIGPPGMPHSASADLVRIAARLDDPRYRAAATSAAADAGGLAPRQALARMGCRSGDALVLVICRIIADQRSSWLDPALMALGRDHTPTPELIPALGVHPALVQLLCQRSHEALYLAHHGGTAQRPPAARLDAPPPHCHAASAISAVLVAPGAAPGPFDEALHLLCGALSDRPPFARVLGIRLDQCDAALIAAVAHIAATGATTIMLVRCTLLPDAPFDALLAGALVTLRQRHPQLTIVISAPLGYDRRSIQAIDACVRAVAEPHSAG